MKDSARYAKIVEWSEEDQCYVGSAPGLVYGGCHGPEEEAVFRELCQIVEEAVALYKREGRPLPPPTAGKDYANKMQDVA
jgi:predicted RNase H-like HicB family nuclease